MSVEQSSVSWQERYRAARTGCGPRLGHELADVASDICNPVVKLRFLRDVIDNRHRVPMSLKYTLLRPLERALLRLRSFAAHAEPATRSRFHVVVNRILVVSLGCLAVLLTAYSLGTQANNPPAAIAPVAIAAPVQATVSVAAPAALPSVAESMPTDALGIAPTTIWLADRGANWELYSNGLRIETLYTVSGEPRRYRMHERTSGVQPTVHTKPVGILFHTSESDLWPLDAGFGKQLRQSSAALLKYVKDQRAYNYVIDRFGRVYRIVDDETRANHAGNSIWANGDDVYLDLNSAFLGVSFESRWEGGAALPITRAQLLAGRNLTNFLRQRYAIAPEMCVTHGLTSVSPKPHLIGYHMDWARGFPFAEFGLPDQYALPPPSIALFGFGYDDEFVRAVGTGWPGAFAADAELAKEAIALGIDIDTLRAQRHALYTKWAREARSASSDRNTVTSTTTAETAANTPVTGQRG
jgi:hypothetical protein